MKSSLVVLVAGMAAAQVFSAFGQEPTMPVERDQKGARIEWVRTLCDDGGNYVGWPTICRRRNGELLAVFSGGRRHHLDPWGKVKLVRSKDEGETWSKPVVLAEGVLDYRDSGIVELCDGTLVLTYFTGFNPEYAYADDEKKYWASLDPKDIRRELGAWTKRSTDGGKTWSKPVRVPASTPHGAVALSDGRLLTIGTQTCFTRGHLKTDPEEKDVKNPDMPQDIVVAESKDGAKSWHELAHIPLGAFDNESFYVCEPTLFEAKDGTLKAYFRHTTGTWNLLHCSSTDGGRTWSAMEETDICGFPPHCLRLRDGRVLLTYAWRCYPELKQPKRLSGEHAVVSCDDGATWDTEGAATLALSDCLDLGYPSSVELSDGSILTVCYQHPLKELVKPSQPYRAVLMGTKWRIKDRRAAPSPAAAGGVSPAEVRIPRIGWTGFWSQNVTAQNYREAADAGLTVLMQHVEGVEQAKQFLDWAGAAGLKLAILASPLCTPSDPAWFITPLKDHPALAYWLLADEPHAKKFPELKKQIARIKALDPKHMVFVNVFGVLYDEKKLNQPLLGYPEWAEYATRYLDETGVELLSWDVYPVYSERFAALPYRNPPKGLILEENMLYKTLELGSRLAAERKIPFWAFTLTAAIRNHSTWDNPAATVNMMKLQQYSNLAYGAQGLEYYVLVTPKSPSDPFNHHLGPVYSMEDTRLTPVFDRMREVNREITAREFVFAGAKVKAVRHVGAKIPECRELKGLPAKWVKQFKADGPALVSALENGGAEYLVVVNKDPNRELTLEAAFEDGVKRVRRDGTMVETARQYPEYWIEPGNAEIFCRFGASAGIPVQRK